MARIEQLYPFPVDAVAELVARYPGLETIVWAQEEPQNMGPWRSIRHRLDEAARAGSNVQGVTYVGRPWRASPSEGYPTAHQREQDRIVREALRCRLRRRHELGRGCGGRGLPFGDRPCAGADPGAQRIQRLPESACFEAAAALTRPSARAAARGSSTC